MYSRLFQVFCYIVTYVDSHLHTCTYICRIIHRDTTIKTQEGRHRKTSLTTYLPLTLLQGFERVVQGLHVRGCWDRTLTFDLHYLYYIILYFDLHYLYYILTSTTYIILYFDLHYLYYIIFWPPLLILYFDLHYLYYIIFWPPLLILYYILTSTTYDSHVVSFLFS